MHDAFERKMGRWLDGKEPDSITPLPDFYREVQGIFGEIVRAGGGELIEFRQDDALVKHMMVLTFGTRWRKEVEALAGFRPPAEERTAH
jgi:hypothetical protein